jgi:uncharacterized protein (TIGR03000 family)
MLSKWVRRLLAPAALALLLLVPADSFAQRYRGGYRGGYWGGYRGGWGGWGGYRYGWGGSRSWWGGPYIGFGLGYPYYSGYGYYGYNPSYYGGYYTSPYYSSTYYVTPSYYTSAPVYTPSYVESSSPMVTDATTAPATVEVRVPANAEVWFGDHKTRQTGSDRMFTSPPLPRDREYTYQIRARWMENGQPVERTRDVRVTGGEDRTVDFLAAEQ